MYSRMALVSILVLAILIIATSFVMAGQIHEAAEKGDLKKVEKFLSENPELLNAGNASQGRTPLHCACAGNDFKMVTFLISKGADIHAKDRDGQTPLHLAGSGEIAELLVAHGADVTARDSYERTPLHYAAYYGRDRLVDYLISVRAEVNGIDEIGNTPLHWAVENNHPGVVNILIGKKAAINEHNQEGASPLSIAKKKGYKEIRDILLKHNAVE